LQIFSYVLTQIRLGFLCHLMVVSGLLFITVGSYGDFILGNMISFPAAAPMSPSEGNGWLHMFLNLFLVGYLLILPFAYAGLAYNLYCHKSLPSFLQKVLIGYTNFFGMILWRVFTIDVLEFYVQIYHEPKSGGKRELISRWGSLNCLRFCNVGESITVTCLFTTLKYYPDNWELFTKRLLRYAKTLPRPKNHCLVFEYIKINPSGDFFKFLSIVEYIIDLEADQVIESVLIPEENIRAPHPASIVQPGVTPGSYVPAEEYLR